MQQRRSNVEATKRYFDPNAIAQGGGFIQLYHPTTAPVWMMEDLLPPSPQRAQELEALAQNAVFYAKHLFKQRDEDVPVAGITADQWNTIAVLYTMGKIDLHLGGTVPYLDAIDETVRKGTRADYSALMGIEDPAAYEETNPEALRQPLRVSESEVVEYIQFLKDAMAELRQRYDAKRQGLALKQQATALSEEKGEGVAKQLGLDTGQPLPMAEYGGATYRHRR